MNKWTILVFYDKRRKDVMGIQKDGLLIPKLRTEGFTEEISKSTGLRKRESLTPSRNCE